jgi:predicted dehydrogenase
MAHSTKAGIIGAGWPGRKHAEGYQQAGGFNVVAVADLIPSRRRAIVELCKNAKEYADAAALLKDADVDVVSVCLPNHLHLPVAMAALKAGKHVVCETPPALTAAEARKIAAASAKSGKTVSYAFQRRFGGNEQAAKQAIDKGYAGNVLHARASWTRTRGVPSGTGWYTDRAKSGGGAMIDLGIHMLELAWNLLGQPRPLTVLATFPTTAGSTAPGLEEAGFAMIRFDGGKSLELAASWALNQPPPQQGTACRVYGDKGAVEVYRAGGPALYRGFGATGESKETVLKLPRLSHHAAMMRHVRDCILGKDKPSIGADQGVVLMQMIDAIYKSVASGKSVEVK